MGVDEGDYFFCRRSSSAPKKVAAACKMSLERRNSLTSLRSSLSSCLLGRGQTRPSAGVDLGLLDPGSQRLVADPELSGHPRDHRLVAGILLPEVLDHPDGASFSSGGYRFDVAFFSMTPSSLPRYGATTVLNRQGWLEGPTGPRDCVRLCPSEVEIWCQTTGDGERQIGRSGLMTRVCIHPLKVATRVRIPLGLLQNSWSASWNTWLGSTVPIQLSFLGLSCWAFYTSGKGGDICDSRGSGSAVQQRLGLYGRSRTPDQPLGPSNEIPRLSKSEKRDAITGQVFLLQQSLEVFCHFRPARLHGLQKSDGFVVSLSTRSFAKAGAASGV